jgi:hypothetical protein
MTSEGHQSDKLTDENISHQLTLSCHQSTPKLTVAEAVSLADSSCLAEIYDNECSWTIGNAVDDTEATSTQIRNPQKSRNHEAKTIVPGATITIPNQSLPLGAIPTSPASS